MLTLDLLKRYLKYDPVSGCWERLVDANNACRAGSKVGCIQKVGKDKKPYLYISVANQRYKAARLAWFYVKGRWPDGIVDHRDGNSLNDVFENLRDCGQKQNTWNRRISVSNSSGYKGVSWNKARKCWRAVINVSGKAILLGEFEDPAQAGAAYTAAAIAHFGEFARAR